MENASKALIMAAGVLIAMMVISLGVYVFNMFGTFSKEQQEELYEHQLAEFNAQFTKYETAEDINIHDIISVANYARDYNESNGVTDMSNDAYISVNILSVRSNLEKATNAEKNNLIKNSITSTYVNKYELLDGSIGYNLDTGRVNSITFKLK